MVHFRGISSTFVQTMGSYFTRIKPEPNLNKLDELQKHTKSYCTPIQHKTWQLRVKVLILLEIGTANRVLFE